MLELSCKVSQASVFELSAVGRIKLRFCADSHSLRCARSTKAYADEPLRDRACQAPILRGFESHLTSCDVCRRFGKSKRDSKLFKDALRRQYQNFFMISVRLRAAEGSAPFQRGVADVACLKTDTVFSESTPEHLLPRCGGDTQVLSRNVCVAFAQRFLHL